MYEELPSLTDKEKILSEGMGIDMAASWILNDAMCQQLVLESFLVDAVKIGRQDTQELNPDEKRMIHKLSGALMKGFMSNSGSNHSALATAYAQEAIIYGKSGRWVIEEAVEKYYGANPNERPK